MRDGCRLGLDGAARVPVPRSGPVASVAAGCALAVLFALAAGARADTVILRSGEVFNGRILRATPEEVSIQIESGGILSFRANRIDRIRQQRPRSEGGSSVILYNDAKAEEEEETEKPPTPPVAAGPPEVLVRPAIPAEKGSRESNAALKELSSFPLHARKARSSNAPGAAMAAAPLSGPPRYDDPKNGYSLVPPPDFKAWTGPKLSMVLQAFMEPETKANLTISIYESRKSLDEVKDEIVAQFPRRSVTKVVRQVRQDISGPGGYHGWLLELENSSGETLVRQLQLLTKSGGKIFIVTCSASAKSFPGFSRKFEESLASLRFETAKPSEARVALPPEVEAHLRAPERPKHAGNPDAPSQIDPHSFGVDTEKLRRRVDEKARLNPLRPYTITP